MKVEEPTAPRWAFEGRKIRIPARRNLFNLVVGLAMVGWLVLVLVAGLSSDERELTTIDWNLESLSFAAFFALMVFLLAAIIGWEVAGVEWIEISQGELRLRYAIGPIGRTRRYDLSELSDLRIVARPAFGGRELSIFISSSAGTIAGLVGKRKLRFGIGLEEAEAKQVLQRLLDLEPSLRPRIRREPVSDASAQRSSSEQRSGRRWRRGSNGIEIPFRFLRPSTLPLVPGVLIWGWVGSRLPGFFAKPRPAETAAVYLQAQAIFALVWLCVGLALVTALLYRLFGRERLRFEAGRLEVRREVFGIGRGRTYLVGAIRDLRHSPVELPWWVDQRQLGRRAAPIAFDYGATTVRFGDSLDESDAHALVRHLLETDLRTAGDQRR